MEKEEILKKYRQEGVDEGREEANRRGDDAGFYAMCVLALLLMLRGGGAVCVQLRGLLCPVPDGPGPVLSEHGHPDWGAVPGEPGLVHLAHTVKKGGRRLIAPPAGFTASALGSRPR